MGVKQTTFTYDSEWSERKKALGSSATWKKVMETGIVTLENEKLVNVSTGDTIRPPEELDEEENAPPSSSEGDHFQLNVTNSIVDVLHEDRWKELEIELIEKDDIVRFRKEYVVESIKGKKRFTVIEVSDIDEEGAVYFTLKPA